MNKRTRLIILLVCIACFLTGVSILVPYSMGYRFDFANMKITATGGIYVRTFPAAEKVIIDRKITEEPGLFSNSVFVQSLLPGLHAVLVQKNSYYDYSKTIPVQEKQVTKLENILLIKKSIAFNNLADNINYFSVAPNNQTVITSISGVKNITLNYSSLNATSRPQIFPIAQMGKILAITWSNDSNMALITIQNKSIVSYYLFNSALLAEVGLQKSTVIRISYLDKNTQQISFNPQDSQGLFFIKDKILYSVKNNKITPIISNVETYVIFGGNITWLSAGGLLYNSDFSGKLIEQLTAENVITGKTQSYKIFTLSNKVFLQVNNSLFLLNQDKKTLEDVTPPENNYKVLISPDNKSLIYWNGSEIYLYSPTDKKYEKIFSGTQIDNCQWLDNYYIIFTNENKIIISETDYRGNINTITLPQTIIIPPEKRVEIENPKIFFNQQDGKLYILTGDTLLSSDKITP